MILTCEVCKCDRVRFAIPNDVVMAVDLDDAVIELVGDEDVPVLVEFLVLVGAGGDDRGGEPGGHRRHQRGCQSEAPGEPP